jgi:hypothetical protein
MHFNSGLNAFGIPNRVPERMVDRFFCYRARTIHPDGMAPALAHPGFWPLHHQDL